MSEQPALLRLPYKVRLRIYRELLIVSDIYYINSAYNPPLGEWSSRDQKLQSHRFGCCGRLPFFNQPFYVSRAISQDARTVFYSENRFRFAHQSQFGLKNLMAISPLGWRSLRWIEIDLNQVYRSCRSGHALEKHEILEIDSHLSRERGVLRDWLQICDLLATHLTHNDQLDLRLSCDASTKETTAAFLEPLYKLPRLRECSIRLGPYWNADLQQMIMTTVWEKTKQPTHTELQVTFRLFDLPLELQLHILGFSELVSTTPLSYQPPLNRFVNQKCHRGDCIAGFRGCRWVGFCPSNHTAFSSALPCWQTPNMIFLVSKKMRQLAIQIFYSRNVFMPECPIQESPPSAAWSSQKSAFLYSFPEYSFQFLRHIRWRLDLNHCDFREGRKETEDWKMALNFISFAVIPGALTLELYLSHKLPSGADLTAPPADNVWELYDRIIEPMACLRGLLKNLFIHLSRFCDDVATDKLRVDKEKSLEQSIMGSDYDSFMRGKSAKTNS